MGSSTLMLWLLVSSCGACREPVVKNSDSRVDLMWRRWWVCWESAILHFSLLAIGGSRIVLLFLLSSLTVTMLGCSTFAFFFFSSAAKF